MKKRIFGSLTAPTLLLLCAGCATLPRQAVIPLGQWEGHGSFVISKWGDGDETASEKKLETECGDYTTSLKIERADDPGPDAIRMEIVSLRGKTELFEGDRTHLVAVLTPMKSLAEDTITLYRLVRFGVSNDAHPPVPGNEPEDRTYASCMVADGEIVLNVHYMDEFTDTLRFRGNAVLKDGSYFDSKSGLIAWSEELDPKR